MTDHEQSSSAPASSRLGSCPGAPDGSNCSFSPRSHCITRCDRIWEHGKPFVMKEPRLSARKRVVLGNSPHPVSTERPVLPHSSKKLKKFAKTGPEDALAIAREEFRRNRFVGHGENYGTIFLHAGDQFWEQVQALRNIERTELDRRKLVLGRRTLESVSWHASLPIQSGRFVRAFIEAVRDRHFPKRHKTQARFLGNL